MARFFIDRPVFAWVIAIIIMLFGVLSIATLPVAQYPQIAPPSVSIRATYYGVSSRVLEDSVTQILEQKLQGLDDLLYMAASSDSAGQVRMELTFDPKVNPDIAQTQVMNKVQLAMSQLPSQVQQNGVRVEKGSTMFVKVYAFISEDGSMSAGDLCDYVATYVQDTLSRVQGVGGVNLFGSQYAMRVWLNPEKLQSYNMVPADIAAAIQAQNAQVSAGQLGGVPAAKGTRLNVTVNAQNRMQTVEQFENILLRTNADGSQVRLRDVARVELGRESYVAHSRFNGRPAAGLGMYLATGGNALDVAKACDKKLEELSHYFPSGMKVCTSFDTTPFVVLSIEEVVKTLVEAIVLVFVVMLVFLQNFRATLIPTIAVPVVLLGTFGVMSGFGFSINTLTMFGLVLAIGLLVDDAIVVVENVIRIMNDERLPPREATRKSMDQITGAIVGIALVLAAVFLPMAFFGGSVGIIYRQFSITIVSSMLLSVVVAIVLTPALCATILKPSSSLHSQQGFFGWFNRRFDAFTLKYQAGVGHVVRQPKRWMLALLLFAIGMGVLFKTLPTSFLPDEDQGSLMVMYNLPPGATQEETEAVAAKVEKYFLENEKDCVRGVMAVIGFSFSGSGQHTGMAFVDLKDWSERDSEEKRVFAVAKRAMAHFSKIREAVIYAFAPPAIIELGTATGFDFELQDRGGLGHEALMNARNQLLRMAAQNPLLAKVRPNGQEDMPQLQITVDREKAGMLGLSLASINNTLSSAWGSSYVDDFINRGRVKKVLIQADAPYRMRPEDFDRWYFRNDKGRMVPFSAVAKKSWIYGPSRLERYNAFPAVNIQGEAAPGQSSGAAMAEMERLAGQLQQGIGFEWTGLSYQERMSGAQAPALYALSVLVVFLCLAALYESWTVPFSVLMIVPLGIFGALAAAMLRGMNNDIYFQVALLATIGLSAKNAILIVEFAKDLYDEGHSLFAAVQEAARLRLRPILMTSFAFLLGVMPLAVSTGAGSGSQNAIGTGVLGGTFAATALGIFFVPIFYVVVMQLFSKKEREARKAARKAARRAAMNKNA
ncbi:MAG: efflux RND transporter permease subunit [Desulfovibrionaceae bacterium]|nr:efflux RND transporter permease subunit [Desulfovibrionaceae bacterium]